MNWMGSIRMELGDYRVPELDYEGTAEDAAAHVKEVFEANPFINAISGKPKEILLTSLDEETMHFKMRVYDFETLRLVEDGSGDAMLSQ